MQGLAELQRRFLPRQVPQPAGWQIAVHCRVSSCPGGNYYDVWPLPDGRVGLLMADASGRGGSAVVMVALVRSNLHSCPLTSGTGRLPYCPVDARTVQQPQVVLGHLSHIVRENSLEGEFLTAFYGLLDPAAGILQYANAGHPLPRLWRPGTGKVEAVPDITGAPLGAGQGEGGVQCNLPLEAGDVVVCFSEGLTGARKARERFGLDRLDVAIREGAIQGAEEVQRRVIASLDEFLAGKDPPDDVTLLVVERKA
jgi:serine phosphatase RsbU (regulator of sigma subunit)